MWHFLALLTRVLSSPTNLNVCENTYCPQTKIPDSGTGCNNVPCEAVCVYSDNHGLGPSQGEFAVPHNDDDCYNYTTICTGPSGSRTWTVTKYHDNHNCSSDGVFITSLVLACLVF